MESLTLSHKKDIVCGLLIVCRIIAPQLSSENSNLMFLSGNIIFQIPHTFQKNMLVFQDLLPDT